MAVLHIKISQTHPITIMSRNPWFSTWLQVCLNSFGVKCCFHCNTLDAVKMFDAAMCSIVLKTFCKQLPHPFQSLILLNKVNFLTTVVMCWESQENAKKFSFISTICNSSSNRFKYFSPKKVLNTIYKIPVQ